MDPNQQLLITIGNVQQIREACQGIYLKGSSIPRVAFVGRSNVGKSSLINALLKSKQARVSQTPGKTKLIHVYQWPSAKLNLVDLPGYGFAKVSENEQKKWSVLLGEYLSKDKGLDLLLVLIDSRVGPTPIDVEAIRYFIKFDVNLKIVMTKFDQLKSQSQRVMSKRSTIEFLQKNVFGESVLPEQIEQNLEWVSIKSKDGIKRLEFLLKNKRREG